MENARLTMFELRKISDEAKKKNSSPAVVADKKKYDEFYTQVIEALRKAASCGAERAQLLEEPVKFWRFKNMRATLLHAGDVENRYKNAYGKPMPKGTASFDNFELNPDAKYIFTLKFASGEIIISVPVSPDIEERDTQEVILHFFACLHEDIPFTDKAKSIWRW